METVRDRFWIFTCIAGSDNDSLEKGGYPGSRMTPAESAFYLDVPNLQLIRWKGLPAPEEFDQYAISFAPLDRVLWSIVGSGGRVEGDELAPVLDLAGRFPNLSGIMMDDFFRKDGSGELDVAGLREVRGRLTVAGRRLDLWVVLYTHQLDLPVAPCLAECDVVSLWTWNADQLTDLEQNLSRLEALNPGGRVALGCYVWDFPNHRPVPVPLMERQCEQALQWLREGRIEHVVFLGNTACDLGLESVAWTRAWIRKVGATPLG